MKTRELRHCARGRRTADRTGWWFSVTNLVVLLIILAMQVWHFVVHVELYR